MGTWRLYTGSDGQSHVEKIDYKAQADWVKGIPTTQITFSEWHVGRFYDWHGVPTIPPEMVLLPNWFIFNIYEMSSWSRAILVPLSVINESRPHRSVPPGAAIDELFEGGRGPFDTPFVRHCPEPTAD